MFNKQPKNITNHYHNVFRSTMEIDYDKLAKAIVKAQQEAEQQKEIENQQEENDNRKLSLRENLKLLGLIIRNKVDSNGTMTSIFFGWIMSLFFNLLAIFSLIILVIGIVASVIVYQDFTWSWNAAPGNIIIIGCCACFEVVVMIVAFIFRCVANEIGKEKDRNYIISVFSALVAFVALVITVVDKVKDII